MAKHTMYLCNIKTDNRFSEFYFRIMSAVKERKEIRKELEALASSKADYIDKKNDDFWDDFIAKAKAEDLLKGAISQETHRFKINHETGEIRFKEIDEDDDKDDGVPDVVKRFLKHLMRD